MTVLSFSTLVWIHIGQLIAFTVGVLLISPSGRAAMFWQAANIVAIAGMSELTLSVEEPYSFHAIVAGAVNLLVMTLRAVAQSHGKLLSKQNRYGTLFVVMGMLGLPLLVLLRDTDFRALVIATSGALTTIGTCIYLEANRAWRGLPGQRQMLALYLVILALLIIVIVRSHPFGANTRFFGNTDFQIIGSTTLMVMAFFMQIFFSNIMLGRKARVQLLAERRSSRNKERARVLLSSRDTIERLAHERLNLLKMMTHEVRQPLNNAQAALQAVLDEINTVDTDPQQARNAAQRVQLVLDEVILSLANSIVAASIIEWKDKPSLVPVGANETLALAAMDCPSTETARLSVNEPEDEIFVFADPVLLRLALRNLLANALKYSPADSKVNIEIMLDDERYGVAFRVTNNVDDPRLLVGDLFARGKRGTDNSYDGFGLGLFMVNETARIHNGSLAFWQSRPEEVTFELFIPA